MRILLPEARKTLIFLLQWPILHAKEALSGAKNPDALPESCVRAPAGASNQAGEEFGSGIRRPDFVLESTGKAWYSMSLCADARHFAPTMSRGSRATQVKPEALVILFRATP
jgi:hypothetical protein